LLGREAQELKELQRQGMSIPGFSKLAGWDRKTIRESTDSNEVRCRSTLF
jgi:hypothetical protein